MTKKPTISVIMPVWNGEEYLRDAIESILGQTFHEFEFIIINDGSTDHTSLILSEYCEKDERVRVIDLDHQGIVTALNLGVAESRGQWIARMDCDDIAHPERLERQWNYLSRFQEAVLCHTQIQLFGDADYITTAPRLIRSDALLRLRLCQGCPIVHPTAMFRKDAFLSVGGYYEAERHAEDYALWGRLATCGRIIGLDQPLLHYRVHASSISKQQAELQLTLSLEISKRHSRQFMSLDQQEAERAVRTLKSKSADGNLLDWFWLVTHCLPAMQKQSIEMWLWVVRSTMRRLLGAIFQH